ncbi:hypothetical protein [Propionicimonas sp.]|uniref:hypothetical protein n=1 Tax=Propionicimonas sp. TaxID=1955623 RepID=UPI001830AB98|nr:hypothetical protein [Propionicimonas sp.]MBU4002912.1 hypothetical protein [Pseudomonadota bacterium]MBU4188286.1 hypothetical protein [Actinomycetota bacterium]MBA3022259.1 hypothetical protein [Propionicimonas sp.]MBU4056260.1 hypothetical protein [Pseudomonadota bacterium]MBU4411400.1 hypothetical protein [Actinomycetota bacterium]
MENPDEVAMVNACYWPDSELSGVSIDYCSVILDMKLTDGRCVRLACHGFTALEMLPVWDEFIVSTLAVSANSELANRASVGFTSSGVNKVPCGCPDRNVDQFWTLAIEMSDGSQIKVVAARFEVLGQ